MGRRPLHLRRASPVIPKLIPELKQPGSGTLNGFQSSLRQQRSSPLPGVRANPEQGAPGLKVEAAPLDEAATQDSKRRV